MNKTFKKIFLLIIILSFSSCKKSEFENQLMNPDKQWCYISDNKYNPKSIITFYMKFYPNGDFENRHVLDNTKHMYIDGQVKDCYWKYSKNDSILELCELKYKILNYEKDTIHLLALKDNFKCLFINYNPKQKK